MNNTLIMAQADVNGSSVVQSQPIASNSQTTTQTASDINNPGQPTGSGSRGPGPSLWIFWGLLIVMMYFLMFRGPKKKQQQHKQMIQSLQKNDRVRTIGGIIGTVIDVKDDEVVLKIDESNNTKIRISASAIGKNMSKDNE